MLITKDMNYCPRCANWKVFEKPGEGLSAAVRQLLVDLIDELDHADGIIDGFVGLEKLNLRGRDRWWEIRRRERRVLLALARKVRLTTRRKAEPGPTTPLPDGPLADGPLCLVCADRAVPAFDDMCETC